MGNGCVFIFRASAAVDVRCGTAVRLLCRKEIRSEIKILANLKFCFFFCIIIQQQTASINQ